MRIAYLSLILGLSLPACGDDKGDDTTQTTQTSQTTTTGTSDPGTTEATITSTIPFTTDDTTADVSTTTTDPSTSSTDPSTTTTDPSTSSTDPSTTTTDPSTTSGETGKTTDETTGDGTTTGGGLGEGEICQDMPDACAKGLLCCYPCGIPDCMNQCMKPDPNTNMCPLFP